MSANELIGKIAVVTGVTSGIGYDIAKTLVKEGLIVVGTGRRLEKLQALKKEATGKGVFYPQQCDITKTDDIKKLFDWVESELGGVDILINNAGIMGTPVHAQDIDVNAWKHVLDTNFVGLAVATKYALKTMRSRGDNGVIVNVNSIGGHMVPSILGSLPISMYVSSKHAVTAFSKCITAELKELKSNIRVTNLSPGLVQSEMTDFFISDNKDISYLIPEDITSAVWFILTTPLRVQINELTISPIHQNL